MKALCWYGSGDVRVETVPDPILENPKDAIIKITSTAICGSDLHLYDGYMPTMEKGDVLGHENMGEVVELGSEVTNLKVGDRVVVPFNIACGECFFCKQQMFSLCDRSNPNADMASAARRCTRSVRNVQEQRGRVYQGRLETLKILGLLVCAHFLHTHTVRVQK